jgi:hypothetical protein
VNWSTTPEAARPKRSGPPATAVEADLARSRRRPLRWLLRLAALVLLLALVVAVIAALRLLGSGTPLYRTDAAHFRYGSIGSEVPSGIPERVWHALPHLFPEEFEGRTDYAAFGFLYDDDRGASGTALPIGISQRERLGVDLVWFNCALCHAGTYRTEPGAEPVIVNGMPSNNLDLNRFIELVLSAADDPRMEPGALMDAMREAGVGLDPIDRLIWRIAVFPALREGLVAQAAALGPLLERQPDWGLGRVDTFNPYKVLEFHIPAEDLSDAEIVGASDYPSIWLQGPREGMWLHWDGNNDSLAERNLSASLGAGVTPETVDHRSVARVAAWLSDLPPPPSPHAPDPEAVERGRAIYMVQCAACHGYQGADGAYVFEGAALGTVEPLERIGTDPARLDSYTQAFSDRQNAELFAGTPHAFQRFRKTGGYANMPLDGLWLRGPYLHNGSVPTLADLLLPPEERPVSFRRDSDVIDPRGGFVSADCEPQAPTCFDTSERGNSNAGHLYGTDLADAEKADLLAYLLTF